MLAVTIIFANAPQAVNAPRVLRHAKQLPSQGTLSFQHDYVYLKVNDQYINSLYPSLLTDVKNNTCMRKPGNSVGAHITLVESGRLKHKDWEKLRSLNGRDFDFQITNINKVKFSHFRGDRHYTKVYYFLTLKSPELEKTLKHRGVAKYLTKEPLHITIAKSRQVNGMCAR